MARPYVPEEPVSYDGDGEREPDEQVKSEIELARVFYGEQEAVEEAGLWGGRERERGTIQYTRWHKRGAKRREERGGSIRPMRALSVMPTIVEKEGGRERGREGKEWG